MCIYRFVHGNVHKALYLKKWPIKEDKIKSLTYYRDIILPILFSILVLYVIIVIPLHFIYSYIQENGNISLGQWIFGVFSFLGFLIEDGSLSATKSNKVTPISSLISKLLISSESLEKLPEGISKEAHDTLVKIGITALPELEAEKNQLIFEYQKLQEKLKNAKIQAANEVDFESSQFSRFLMGPNFNPHKNYYMKISAIEKYYSRPINVIKIKQEYINDVIAKIKLTDDKFKS